MLESKIRLRVKAVKAVRDPENSDRYQMDFVEVRTRPPMVTITPTEVPEEVGRMVNQIGKTVKQVLPGANTKEYELKKLTMILTEAELEAFNLKPYPNQTYEVTITDGSLKFEER